MALSEGRLSKWEQLLDELDYHQLAVLQAYAKVRPFGERRADMREAWMAAGIMGAFCGEAPDPNKLTDYLASDEDDQPAGFVSPNSAAASMAQMFPGLIK